MEWPPVPGGRDPETVVSPEQASHANAADWPVIVVPDVSHPAEARGPWASSHAAGACACVHVVDQGEQEHLQARPPGGYPVLRALEWLRRLSLPEVAEKAQGARRQ